MAQKKWQCKRCSKNYLYKGGLMAHIRRKHPVGVKDMPKNKTPASASPNPTIVSDLITMDTHDLEDLLDDEQDYYDAAEEVEHNLGVNASMVDWFNVKFQSSFSNTGEFTNRTASVVLQPNTFQDCKISATTFEEQIKLLLKQDKMIQDSHKTQKESNDENKKLRAKTKSLEAQLEETTSLLETAMDESASEINALKAELKTKIDFIKSKSKKAPDSSKEKDQNRSEVEVSMEKCKSCKGFSPATEWEEELKNSNNGVVGGGELVSVP